MSCRGQSPQDFRAEQSGKMGRFFKVQGFLDGHHTMQCRFNVLGTFGYKSTLGVFAIDLEID